MTGTQIVCWIKDCIHNSGQDRCGCTVIGVRLKDGVPCCDSYLETPELIKDHLKKGGD